MRLRIYTAAFLVTLAGLASHQALAAKEVRTLETQQLLAERLHQQWSSKPLSGTVYAHVYSRGQELKQKYISPCSARYSANGLVVLLRLRGGCFDRPVYHFRYWSNNGRGLPFRIELTRSPLGSGYLHAARL